MNLERSPLTGPLRVLLVNPLLLTTELLAEKILSGSVFGEGQAIHLIFLAKENEISDAEVIKWALERCAFNSTSCIEITSSFPRISDADVFCIMTNLRNPNSIDIGNITQEEINIIHNLIPFANNLIDSTIHFDDDTDDIIFQDKIINPIIMVDGLITMNIVYNCCNIYILKSILFCPNPLDSIAVKILAENLKTDCDSINDRVIWAANDQTFHIEVMKPLINPTKSFENQNDKEQKIKDTKIDSSSLNDNWLKKYFIEKIKSLAGKNPYGPIYKATVLSATLKDIWSSRIDNKTSTWKNIGVISEGSYQTIKGAPYVMPIVFKGCQWTVVKDYEKDYHLIQEIKRMNLVAQDNVQAIKNYYKKFADHVAEPSTTTSVNSSAQ